MPTIGEKIAHRLGFLEFYYWLPRKVVNFYNWLRRPNFDGSHSRTWWASRDGAATSSAESYWANRTHPSRDAIARTVAKLPGNSLLEIGIHAGPTMWAIAQRKHFDRLAGVEISPAILEFARANLPQALGRPVELVETSADKLPFDDKSFDIVVTGAVLVCIGPEHIFGSLSEIVRVCRGYLVMAEPFSNRWWHATARGKKDRYPNTSYWVRNYAGLLKKEAELISVEQLPAEVQTGHLQCIAVFKMKAASL